MDGEKPLLTGLDYGLDEEKWAWLRHDESETDDRSILEVYREEGYTDACYIAASIYCRLYTSAYADDCNGLFTCRLH